MQLFKHKPLEVWKFKCQAEGAPVGPHPVIMHRDDGLLQYAALPAAQVDAERRVLHNVWWQLRLL